MDHSYSYSFDAENQVFRIAPCFSIIPKIRTNQNDGSIIKADAIHHLFEHTPQIVFEVTEKCNFDCAYCGYGENYKQPQLRPLHSNRFMKWETAKAVLDYYLDVWRRHDCATMIRIGFYGGEPLLNYSLIKQIVNYLKDNKPYHISFGWFITTNGSLLKKYSSFLIENDFSIAVSIDGDAVANSLRIRHNGEPTYSVVMDNIDYLYHNYSDFFRKSISFQSVITNKVNSRPCFSQN